jgi:uncharacterized protein (TIGR02118 family)
MVKVTVLYPNTDDGTFDMGYYLGSHIPLAKESLGPACLTVTVDQGLAGVGPGEPAAFAAICNLTFESMESLREAFGPAAGALVDDVPNFTNTRPTVQISEVKI